MIFSIAHPKVAHILACAELEYLTFLNDTKIAVHMKEPLAIYLYGSCITS
jgi:hypothetical protein